MELGIMKQYLRDIIDLERERRIAANTYNRLLTIENNEKNTINYTPAKESSKWGIFKMIGVSYAIYIIFAIIIDFTLPMNDMSETSQISVITAVLIIAVLIVIFLKFYEKVKINTKYKNNQLKAQENARKSASALVLIQNDKSELNKAYRICSESLTQLYSIDVIYPKYRTMEACGMFLEYLESGRCNTLQGAYGAYNLYEQELRMGIIINKLDQILENQQLLRKELQNINYNVEQLCQNMSNLEEYAKQSAKNSRISAWCNSITAYNTNALRRMQENYHL